MEKCCLIHASLMCIMQVYAEPENPSMSKRLNIVLPDAAVTILDRVAPKGNRSRFITQAVLHYVQTLSAANLRERLKQGAGDCRGVVPRGARSMAETRTRRTGEKTFPQRGEIYLTALDPRVA
jgi:hypothetical protein